MKQCPLHSPYRFITKCGITTCKMYTEHTDNRCMLLDTSFTPNDKTVSDLVLLRYKKPTNNIREVTALRKKVVQRAQAVIALYAIVEHIRNNEPVIDFTCEEQAQPLLDRALRSKIFRIQYLEMERWMLFFILDEEYTSKIVPTFSSYAIHLLFKLTVHELNTLKNSITKARTQDVQSKIQADYHPRSRAGAGQPTVCAEPN